MIYLDTSVALAHLLAEDRTPPERLWEQPLVSSRLMEYEAWTRIHALRLTRSHAEPLRMVLSRVAFIELAPPVLARAIEPFPVPVRTVKLIFQGATVTYTMKVYDGAGQLLGTAQKASIHCQGDYPIEFASDSANISRITFGRQGAGTIVKEIHYSR